MLIAGVIEAKWKAPQDRGNYNHWFRTQIPESFEGDKGTLPLFRTLYRDYSIMTLDFDNKPEDLSWAEFKDRIERDLDEYGVRVGYTPSGRLKAFIMIQHLGVQLTAPEMIDIMEQLIPEELMKYVDLCQNSITQAFINTNLWECLNSFYKFVPARPRLRSRVLELVQHKFNVNTTVEIPKCLNKFIDKPDAKTRAARKQFLHTLLSLPSLAKESGFNLPITKFAKECGVEHGSVSYWIKEMVALGWLELIDGSTKMFRKAKTYKAGEALLMYIKQLNAARGTLEGVLSKPYVQGNRFWILYYMTKINLDKDILRVLEIIRARYPDFNHEGEKQVMRMYKCFYRKMGKGVKNEKTQLRAA